MDERAGVPRILRGALYALLLAAGLSSLPFIGAYGPLPTTNLLDIWIIAFLVTMLLRRRTDTTVLLLLLAVYALTRIIPAVLTDAPMADFLQAYRWLLYLAVFAVGVGKRWGPTRPLVQLGWAMLGMATLKAAMTFLILGPGDRPGLLLENNFELALFAGLIALTYDRMGRYRAWSILLLGLLTLLDASRSGAVGFVIVAIYAIIRARGLNLLTRFMLGILAPLLVTIPLVVFAGRLQNSATDIDRIRFAKIFLQEVADWNWFQWLFGTTPITPLSPWACSSLSFYETLFSSTGDGTCYVVILHAFVLRVTFDAGIVGLLISVLLPIYLQRRAGVPWMLTLTIVLIEVTNGFSVSGLNNPYVSLPILLAIVAAGRDSRAGPRTGVGSGAMARNGGRPLPVTMG